MNEDPSKETFHLEDADHTVANPLRYVLNKDPRVSYCGYVIPPHNFDGSSVNIRVQTTGDPARKVLEDTCHVLKRTCQHVISTFDEAVKEFKAKKEGKK